MTTQNLVASQGDQPTFSQSFKLSKYYQKLKNGVFIDEILETQDREEELFITQNLNLLKAYEDSLTQRKLVECINSMKNNVPLNQIINEATNRDLARLASHIQSLQILEKELQPHPHEVFSADEKAKNDISIIEPSTFEDSERKAVRSEGHVSPDHSPELRNHKDNTSFWNSPSVSARSEKPSYFSSFYKPPTESHIEMKPNKRLAKLSFFEGFKKSASQSRMEERKEGKGNLENRDPDDDEVVTFGETLKGATFKEILENEKNYFAWFRWLKYRYRTVTSDPEGASKAYEYFKRHLKYWDCIPPYQK